MEPHLQAGLNLSYLRSDPIHARVKPGANLGFYLNINLTDWLYLQPGTLYSMKGGMDYEKYDRVSYAYTLHYFEFPAHIGFKLKVGGSLSVLLHTGPYIAVGIAEQFHEDGWFRGDAGWNFGGGIRRGKIYVGT